LRKAGIPLFAWTMVLVVVIEVTAAIAYVIWLAGAL
jgi:hypothetical protein